MKNKVLSLILTLALLLGCIPNFSMTYAENGNEYRNAVEIESNETREIKAQTIEDSDYVDGNKADYHIKVMYVDKDNENEDIKAVYRLESDDKYPTTKSGSTGKAGEAISNDHLDTKKAPKFIGYKITNTVKTVPTPEVDKNAEYTTDGKYTVKFIYEKIDDIVGPLELKQTDEFPDGYVAVKFFADDANNYRGEFTGKTKAVVYAVNPINTEIDTVAKKLNGKTAKGVDINKEFPTYSVKDDSKATWKKDDKNPWKMTPNDAIKADKKIGVNEFGKYPDLTFTAQYLEKDKHTVTFDADNGTAHTTQQVTDGQTATAPTTKPTKNGYTFKGWQLLTNGNLSGTEYNFDTAVTSDITLKAVYTENDVIITYEAKTGGTIDKITETIKAVSGTPEGSTATPDNNYRFIKWTKDGDTNFKVNTVKVTPQKNDGVYVAAKYTAHFAKEVSVIYDLNPPTGFTANGSVPTDNNKYIAGEKADVKALPQGAGVAGCQFLGWSKDKSATTATYTVGSKLVIEGEKDNKLYAIWKKDTKTVEFSFKFYKSKKPTEEISANVVSGRFDPKIPEKQTDKYVGDNIVLPTMKDETAVKNKKGEYLDLQGTWKFDGWYRGDKKLTDAKVSANDAANKLVGKWILTETPSAYISYKFEIDPSIVGDDKVVKSTHTLPEGVNKQKFGLQTVGKYIGNMIKPDKAKDKFTAVSEEIDGKKGFWTFEKWNPEELTVTATEANNVFKGTWTWKEADKVTVKYVFNTNPADKKLPKELEDLKPNGIEEIYETDVVAPKALDLSSEAIKKALVEKDKDGKVVGTWSPGKWEKTVDTSGNVTFTLTWTWKEADKVAVKYVFNTNPADKKLPEVLNKLKPSDITEPIDSDKVVDPVQPDVSKDPAKAALVEKDKDGKEVGTWSPGKWGKTVDTLGNVTFTLTWTFTKPEEPKPTPQPQPTPDYNPWWPSYVGSPKTEPKKETKPVAPGSKYGLEIAKTHLNPKFTDVPAELKSAVEYLATRGIMVGTNETTFSPKSSMTRAMVVTTLYRISADKNFTKVDKPFTDVKSSDWFYEAVLWAKKNGIVAGYEEGDFRPNQNVSRQEFAVIIMRFLKDHGIDMPSVEEFKYSDGKDIPTWSKDAVELMNKIGLIVGKDNENYKPYGEYSRGELAETLYKLIQFATK